MAVYIQRQVELTVGRMTGESSEMDHAANRILNAVRAKAAGHVVTGEYIRELYTTPAPGLSGNGRLVKDRLVVADHPAALAIENGHIQHTENGPEWVPGLHIMRDGLAAVS